MTRGMRLVRCKPLTRDNDENSDDEHSDDRREARIQETKVAPLDHPVEDKKRDESGDDNRTGTRENPIDIAEEDSNDRYATVLYGLGRHRREVSIKIDDTRVTGYVVYEYSVCTIGGGSRRQGLYAYIRICNYPQADQCTYFHHPRVERGYTTARFEPICETDE